MKAFSFSDNQDAVEGTVEWWLVMSSTEVGITYNQVRRNK